MKASILSLLVLLSVSVASQAQSVKKAEIEQKKAAIEKDCNCSEKSISLPIFKPENTQSLVVTTPIDTAQRNAVLRSRRNGKTPSVHLQQINATTKREE